MIKSHLNARFALCMGAVLVFLSACQKADEINPSIVSILVNDETTEHPHAIAGQDLDIHVRLSDNADLGQVKVSFSDMAGHQDPDEEVSLLECPNVGEWPVLKIQNLTGKEDEVIFELQCPDTIQGVWEVEIEVIDKAGNTVSTSFPLHVQNDFLPYIGVDAINGTIDENSIAQFQIGQNLVLNGEALDQDGDLLQSVYCSMENNSGIVWEQTWTPSEWSFDLNQIVVPSFTEAGEYLFTIRVTDNESQVYWKTLDILVE